MQRPRFILRSLATSTAIRAIITHKRGSIKANTNAQSSNFKFFTKLHFSSYFQTIHFFAQVSASQVLLHSGNPLRS